MMNDTPRPLTIVDSVTDLDPTDRGSIVVTGSHGGTFPCLRARDVGVAGIATCDAGRGRDDAGIAGLQILHDAGVPAVAAAADSCRIGSGQDVFESGVVSACNASAAELAIAVGMTVAGAVKLMRAARPAVGDSDAPFDHSAPASASDSPTTAHEEVRAILPGTSVPVWILASASLVAPADEGAIIITGSHGGAPGGSPARALKCQAMLAAFNDAGIGKDAAGISRLPLLEARGVPAVTISAASARIGDGYSTLADGIISVVNERAAALGAEPSMPLAELVAELAGPAGTPVRQSRPSSPGPSPTTPQNL